MRTINMRHIVQGDLKEQTDPVHTFSDFNLGSTLVKYPGFKKTIAGMIGYSYDFDLLKILLKQNREYVFRLVTPLQSPNYIKMDLIDNFNEPDGESQGEAGTPYPLQENINGVYEKVNYTEIDLKTEYVDKFKIIGGYTPYRKRSSYEETSWPTAWQAVGTKGWFGYPTAQEQTNFLGHRSQILEIYNHYGPRLIYLKIYGAKNPDPLDADKGFSEYGSVGKYFLEISTKQNYTKRNGGANIENSDNLDDIIPNITAVPPCFIKLFTDVDNGTSTTVIITASDGTSHSTVSKLFVKKSNSNQNGEENRAHFISIPAWVPDGDGLTGHVEYFNILVYGQLISKADYDEYVKSFRDYSYRWDEINKYYFPVIHNNQIKYQELVSC